MSGLSDSEVDAVVPLRSEAASVVNRRRVLRGVAGFAGTLAAVGYISQQTGDAKQSSTVDATPETAESHPEHEPTVRLAATPVPWESEELVEPEEIRSVDGLLSTTIVVDYAYQHIGGYELFMRSFNGTAPGPTLRVQPGDVLQVEIVNNLGPNRDQMPENHNIPHHLNTTNFHAHGTHVSPGGISDNVLRLMEPGGSYPVEIAFPDDHTSGTLWYHPHVHGSADIQVASGMVGALIVEGDFADVPEIANAQERLLILREVVFDSYRTIEGFETTWPETANRFHAVNGQREPIVRMRPGEVQRWRLINASYQDDILLGLEGHEVNAIARDGISHDHMDTSTTILMAPGQRVDLLIKAGKPGSYLMSALPNDQGYPSSTGPLAHLIVEGEALEMPLPGSLPASPLAPVLDSELTGSRTVTFTANAAEADAAGHFEEFDFLIDGKPFDPNRIDHRIALGSVEEWTIVNDHLHDHIFHIHINPFMVTKINDEPLDDPVWLDTVVVPRFGSIVFRSRFIDYTGQFVLHCHMMNHEDLGMMQLIEVYDPA